MPDFKFPFRNNGRSGPGEHRRDCVCEGCRERRTRKQVRGLLADFAGKPETGRPGSRGFSRRKELISWGIFLGTLILIGTAVWFVRGI